MQPLIGIIGGKGRMGQLFRNFFERRGIKVLISDLNTKLNAKELAQKSDIIIFSVPIDQTEKVIKETLPFVRPESALMDFTSIKVKPVKAMLKGKCEVLGMHPMFGDSNPIPGQTVLLTPTKKSGPWSKWMEDFLHKHQVKLIKMTPKEHDQTMAVAQGLVHFAEIAFADAIRRTKMPPKELFQYCSPASQLKVQLAARLISQSSNLYGNIQIQNPANIKALKNCKKAVDELYKIVKSKNLKKFEKYFEENRQFLDAYADEAYRDSSYLIDKFFEKKRSSNKSHSKKTAKQAIAVLGPANSFTDLCAQKFRQKHQLKSSLFYASTIPEVFELVAAGKVASGIIPVENKLHGTVRETIDGLFEYNVHISEAINLSIKQNLITLANASDKDIKKIVSHPQALSQCQKFIKKHFPKATIQEFSSTSAAAEKLINSRNRNMAVIASEIAAEDPVLKILHSNISDQKDNSTTFLLIKKGSTAKQAQGQLTSIAFYFNQDSPGSLFTVFEDFAKAKINMTKIESRPTKTQFGDYIFYLDFEGGLQDANVKKVLKAVEKKVAKLKILGTYNLWT